MARCKADPNDRLVYATTIAICVDLLVKEGMPPDRVRAMCESIITTAEGIKDAS